MEDIEKDLVQFESFYYLLQSRFKNLQVKRQNIAHRKWWFTRRDQGYLKAMDDCLKVLKKEYYDFIGVKQTRKSK